MYNAHYELVKWASWLNTNLAMTIVMHRLDVIDNPDEKVINAFHSAHDSILEIVTRHIDKIKWKKSKGSILDCINNLHGDLRHVRELPRNLGHEELSDTLTDLIDYAMFKLVTIRDVLATQFDKLD